MRAHGDNPWVEHGAEPVAAGVFAGDEKSPVAQYLSRVSLLSQCTGVLYSAAASAYTGGTDPLVGGLQWAPCR